MSDKNNTTIATKLAQLDELVAWFEGDEFDLEQALEKFAEAESLTKAIQEELGEFKNKINLIKHDFGNE